MTSNSLLDALNGVGLPFADNQAYAHANKLFMEAVAGIYEEGDIVLVHDYDLMLLPALLRKRFPDITCGFFLHCPFPSTGERFVATLRCSVPMRAHSGWGMHMKRDSALCVM